MYESSGSPVPWLIKVSNSSYLLLAAKLAPYQKEKDSSFCYFCILMKCAHFFLFPINQYHRKRKKGKHISNFPQVLLLLYYYSVNLLPNPPTTSQNQPPSTPTPTPHYSLALGPYTWEADSRPAQTVRWIWNLPHAAAHFLTFLCCATAHSPPATTLHSCFFTLHCCSMLPLPTCTCILLLHARTHACCLTDIFPLRLSNQVSSLLT